MKADYKVIVGSLCIDSGQPSTAAYCYTRERLVSPCGVPVCARLALALAASWGFALLSTCSSAAVRTAGGNMPSRPPPDGIGEAVEGVLLTRFLSNGRGLPPCLDVDGRARAVLVAPSRASCRTGAAWRRAWTRTAGLLVAPYLHRSAGATRHRQPPHLLCRRSPESPQSQRQWC